MEALCYNITIYRGVKCFVNVYFSKVIFILESLGVLMLRCIDVLRGNNLSISMEIDVFSGIT